MEVLQLIWMKSLAGIKEARKQLILNVHKGSDSSHLTLGTQLKLPSQDSACPGVHLQSVEKDRLL